MDARGLKREARSWGPCGRVRPMSGVESSRESGMRLLRAGPEWGRPGNAVWGEGREQASEAVQGGGAVWGPPVLPRGAALREGPRAFGSQRQRKSLKTFFLFSQPARPSSRSSSPPPRSGGGGGGGGSSQTLGPWAAPRRLLPPFPAEAGPAGGFEPGGAPEGASPLPPAGGLAVWRIRGGRKGVGRPGARRAAAAATGWGGGGFLKPPRPHPGSARGGGGPQGEGMGGAGPQSSSRVGGLRGGSLKPWGEGAGTRLRPTNRVLPPGG